MPDQAEANESAFVHKYDDDQVAQSRGVLAHLGDDREPEGADLEAHHDAPAGGIAGDHPDASEEEA